MEGLVDRWAALADVSGAMAIPGRIMLLTCLAFHEESQREGKMQFVVRHALLGEVREDRTFRIFVGAYKEDAQFRERDDWERAKLPYIMSISENYP